MALREPRHHRELRAGASQESRSPNLNVRGTHGTSPQAGRHVPVQRSLPVTLTRLAACQSKMCNG